jgi:hypothetical protein
MSQFGISQNFRNAKLLGRFARTEHETKNKKAKIVVEDESSVSSSSSSSSVKSKKTKVVSQSQPSANKLSAVTARYITKSADHL